MKHYPILFTLLVLAASVLGCNVGNGTSVLSAVPSPVPSSVPTVENTPLPPTPTPARPYVSAPGVSAISLLTTTDGSGVKPLFEWTPVDGAVRYQLFVYDSSGAPYWAWEGTQA